MKHKNLRSSKIQLFFFTAMPSILVYVGVLLAVLGILDVADVKSIGIGIAVVGFIWSILGGFICAANMSLIKAIGAPRRAEAKLSIGREKMSASLDLEFSAAQVGQFYINLFFTLLLTIPVALLGWLLFILYCKGKFLKKLSRMAIDCDYADRIIYTEKATIDELAKYFYRMIDYIEVYKGLGEKKGANEMIDRAEKLLEIWEELELKN